MIRNFHSFQGEGENIPEYLMRLLYFTSSDLEKPTENISQANTELGGL